MRLNEFAQINLAVNFHDELNPKLWKNNHLRLEVRKALMRIAHNFKDSIGIDLFDLADITISGSNAAYTYTDHSDIDLHLVVIIPDAHRDELKELFDAKKYQYNTQHNIKIRGYAVELYVQDVEEKHHSMGIYSVMRDRWVHRPKRQRAQIDDIEVQEKYKCIKHCIHRALVTDNYDSMRSAWESVRRMRQTGLETGGEFSSENLTFKILRADGTLDKLYRHMGEIQDQSMSLPEDHIQHDREDLVEVDIEGEETYQRHRDIINHFINWVYKKERISAPMPTIKFADQKETRDMHHTGWYDVQTNTMWVYTGHRNLIDILRTVAHELTHRKQGEQGRIKGHSPAGSKLEREADAEAGYLMKLYGKRYPEIVQ
jgi:hypothetical protein